MTEPPGRSAAEETRARSAPAVHPGGSRRDAEGKGRFPAGAVSALMLPRKARSG